MEGNVYFVQVDVSASLGAPSAYLPYTAGTLAANAWTDVVVKEHFRLKEFLFLRESIETVLPRLETPAIAAFCNYCWNTEYNKALAKRIKETYPECVVVFGGHNVPDDFSFLEDYPFIDVLCHGEGEETIRLLFRAIALDGDLHEVPNISFRDSQSQNVRTQNAPLCALDFPSPYLEGLFDPLLAAHPEITFNAILETSRGCPHQCAYCDWGMLNTRVRLFPMERIRAEIQWLSAHRIAFVWGADANFGLFARDLEIADALVEAKKQNGYPERMRMNYAKNNFKNVFQIVKKFKEYDFDRIGATLSFQSLSPTVLQNIGRTNSDLAFYKNLLTQYNAQNMKTYSELILGLPGETYESFIRGIGCLFEIGQHFVFDVYQCIVLPNAKLGKKESIQRYAIRTEQAEIIRPHFRFVRDDVPEYNRIVVETNTLPRAMWVKATVFYFFAMALHGTGFLRAFAIYLFAVHHLPYEQFYNGLCDYYEAHPELSTSALYAQIHAHAEERSVGNNSRKLIFEPCGDIIWDDHEYIALNILHDPDAFYADTVPYLKQFGMEPQIFQDLLSYQRGILRLPNEAQRILDLQYDIHGFLTDAYLNRLHAPQKKKHRLYLVDPDVQKDWKSFGKNVVWYGRMGWASYKSAHTEQSGDPFV